MFSSFSLLLASSSFFAVFDVVAVVVEVVDVLALAFGGALDMAAALAAATLDAAAVGFPAVVESVVALVAVADVVLLSDDVEVVVDIDLAVDVVVGFGFEVGKDLFAAAADEVVCLKEDDDALLLVNLDVDVVGFFASLPEAGVLADDGRLTVVVPGFAVVEDGFCLLLEAELALDALLDNPGVVEEGVFDRVEEVGRLGGSLASLVSGFGLVESVLGTVGFLVADTSGLVGIAFRSMGFAAAPVVGVFRATVPPEATEELVDPVPDLVDLASSPGLALPAKEADAGLVEVVRLAEDAAVAALPAVAGLVAAGVVRVAPGFVAAVFAAPGVGFAAPAFAAAAGALGVALVADLAPADGLAPVEVFLGETDVATTAGAGVSWTAETCGISAGGSVRGVGAGDISLTGVAGVTATSGMARLDTAAAGSSAVSTEVSGSGSWSGENSANISPPFWPGVFSMKP